MVDIEDSELLGHVNGCVEVGHQIFMLNFILPANLIDDEF